MEQLEHYPLGETGAMRSQNDSATPTGWRKATQALQAAHHLGRAGQHQAIEKGRAIVAVKRVAARIGLKAADVLLLDTLFAFSKPQDWTTGQRPIVWPSNAFLMEQTGFSKSTLKRHARRLVETGLITFHDSPNGKRWGRRDADGVIVEAYGFDLGPVAARTEDLEALAQEIAHERVECLKLKRQITIARRNIRALLETVPEGDLAPNRRSPLHERLNDLLAQLSGRPALSEALSMLASAFKELLGDVQTMLTPALTTSEQPLLDPTEVIDEPHIQTTQKNPQILSNDQSMKDSGPEKKQTPYTMIKLATVLSACPQFTAWARDIGGMLRNWSDLHQVTSRLRPMIGISDRTWALAIDQLGPQLATKALVLVFDKHCCGEVKSPGGYLRGMIEKSRLGTLHLDRSFFGRLQAQSA